jgi:hypothetical protein
MLAQSSQAHARRQVMRDKIARRLGKEHLPAVPGRADACSSVDVQTNIATGSDRGLTGVQCHAYTDLDSLRPGVSRDGALCRDSRYGGIRRTMKSDEETIARRVDLVTISRLESST